MDIPIVRPARSGAAVAGRVFMHQMDLPHGCYSVLPADTVIGGAGARKRHAEQERSSGKCRFHDK